MSKVFISGSRRISKFAGPVIQKTVARLQSLGHEIIVGDCSGVDFMVQEAAKSCGCKCTVYHMYNRPRNWVPGLPTVQVEGFGFSTKDLVMAQDCDWAIAFTNGWSPGTSNNIKGLRSKGKVVHVWCDGTAADPPQWLKQPPKGFLL